MAFRLKTSSRPGSPAPTPGCGVRFHAPDPGPRILLLAETPPPILQAVARKGAGVVAGPQMQITAVEQGGGHTARESRFKIAVQNAVRNVLRSCSRRELLTRAIGIGPAVGEVPAHAIPDRRHEDAFDDETLTAFRAYFGDALGQDAVKLLDRRLDGVSVRQLASDPAFTGFTAWALRRLMQSVRDAALIFARRQGDDEFLNAIERMVDG